MTGDRYVSYTLLHSYTPTPLKSEDAEHPKHKSNVFEQGTVRCSFVVCVLMVQQLDRHTYISSYSQAFLAMGGDGVVMLLHRCRGFASQYVRAGTWIFGAKVRNNLRIITCFVEYFISSLDNLLFQAEKRSCRSRRLHRLSHTESTEITESGVMQISQIMQI